MYCIAWIASRALKGHASQHCRFCPLLVNQPNWLCYLAWPFHALSDRISCNEFLEALRNADQPQVGFVSGTPNLIKSKTAPAYCEVLLYSWVKIHFQVLILEKVLDFRILHEQGTIMDLLKVSQSTQTLHVQSNKKLRGKKYSLVWFIIKCK